MMILVGAVVATFLATSYANNNSLTFNSQAANNCKQISCGTIVTGATSNFYAKNGKYFGDNSCKKELTQGVGNYCRGNKTAAGNDLCIKESCPDNPQRVIYKKAGKYFGNSDCTGGVSRGFYCAIPSTTPGSGTSISCLYYTCTSLDSDKGIAGRYYSVKQGGYYQGATCSTPLKALVGVGKYCRGTYVKFSCYNWWNAFDARNETTGEHDTLLTDLDRSQALYTNDNGATWASDTKGTALTESPHDYCTL